jgi:DNA-binding response OmpR family regulator
VKIFSENWHESYEYTSYSAIICKTTKGTIFNDDLIKKINGISKLCPVFILDEGSYAVELFKGPQNNIYIFNKGMSLRKLAFLIKKLVNTNIATNKNALKVCDLELYPQTREAERFGKKYYLRNKEFQLLEFLMTNTDQILSRQKILETVWDRNANLFTNTIDTHIHSLRKKLDYNEEKQIIETIPCSGYIMHSKYKNAN